MQLSIIIPTYNEEQGISSLLAHLQKVASGNVKSEIIVVDGGSTDATLIEVERISNRLKLDVIVCVSPNKGRAAQMNFGARKASGDCFYFLHADTFPPNNFEETILDFIQNGIEAGSFRMKFDIDSRFFNFWSWFTRFKWNVASGGDQSLFVLNKGFKQINGFDENWSIMEDVDIIIRLKKHTNYRVVPLYVVTSSRKYSKIGAFKLQSIFIYLQIQRMLGRKPEKMYEYYKRKLAKELNL